MAKMYEHSTCIWGVSGRSCLLVVVVTWWMLFSCYGVGWRKVLVSGPCSRCRSSSCRNRVTCRLARIQKYFLTSSLQSSVQGALLLPSAAPVTWVEAGMAVFVLPPICTCLKSVDVDVAVDCCWISSKLFQKNLLSSIAFPSGRSVPWWRIHPLLTGSSCSFLLKDFAL